MHDQYIIFCDGASKGNPGSGGWAAIIASPDSVREIGGREDHTTNNRMEISAAIGALEAIPRESDVPILLHTDSSYLINGITKWVKGWQQRGWVTASKEPVANRDLWERLVDLAADKRLSWTYVPGHSGVPANERVDEIATGLAERARPSLYEGSRGGYRVSLAVRAGVAPARSAKAAKKGSAYSYVSSVGGEVRTHASWKECESRVKGVAGALFRKSYSAEDERRVIEDFSSRRPSRS